MPDIACKVSTYYQEDVARLLRFGPDGPTGTT